VIGLVFLVLLVLAVVAFIPQATPIGAEGSRAGAGIVSGFVRAGEHLARGRTLGRRFSESEINGFFLGDKARQMKVESFSADITEGAIRARMVRKLPPFKVGSWQIQPTLSCEAVFVPNGKRLSVRSARHGMLPLVGPIKSLVGRLMQARLSNLPESAGLQFISEIRASDDSLEITLKN
jgi:hypothetical protein